MPGGEHGAEELLELIAQVVGLLDLEEFRAGVLRALQEAVPSKWVSLNEIAPEQVIAVLAMPPFSQEWVTRFAALAHENPLYQHHHRTGDGRAYRFSDVTSREQLEATRLFQEFYRLVGVRHQIAFTLPSETRRVLAIALSREDRDYTDAERDFLNRARPFLIQAYRNAVAHSARTPAAAEELLPALERAGLTPREAEVLRLVAHGASNHDVAQELELSVRTVGKHLERVFAKLGVTTRSAAAARAWEIASGRD
jgi:ATP/maltotriose-dependent transcriptional regulator MalT